MAIDRRESVVPWSFRKKLVLRFGKVPDKDKATIEDHCNYCVEDVPQVEARLV